MSILKKKRAKTIKASSEFTFLLILASLRKLILAKEKVTMGYWRNIENELRGFELSNKNVGIIGYGRIGKNIEKYSKAFGASVKIYDPYVSKIESKNLTQNINNVLRVSDIVVVCITYNKKNNNFVNKRFFNKLKKGCIFVNTSRGEVVDESALIKAISSKKISCAATDVVRNEQYLSKKKNKLIEYSKNNHNLLITPHMAGLTYDSERKAAEITIDNIKKFFYEK